MIGIALGLIGTVGLGYVEGRRTIDRYNQATSEAEPEGDGNQAGDQAEPEPEAEPERGAFGTPGGDLDGEALRAAPGKDYRYQLMGAAFIPELDPYMTPAGVGAAWPIMVAHHALETTNRDGEPFKAFVKNTSNTCGLNAVADQPYVVARDSDGTDHKFRKFENVNDCIRQYVSLVRRRYPDAWAAAIAGDVTGYALGLKYGDKGQAYYGASLQDFTSGLKSRYKYLINQIGAWGIDA